jgi:hypothetical protein
MLIIVNFNHSKKNSIYLNDIINLIWYEVRFSFILTSISKAFEMLLSINFLSSEIESRSFSSFRHRLSILETSEMVFR